MAYDKDVMAHVPSSSCFLAQQSISKAMACYVGLFVGEAGEHEKYLVNSIYLLTESSDRFANVVENGRLL